MPSGAPTLTPLPTTTRMQPEIALLPHLVTQLTAAPSLCPLRQELDTPSVAGRPPMVELSMPPLPTQRAQAELFMPSGAPTLTPLPTTPRRQHQEQQRTPRRVTPPVAAR